MTIKDAEEKTGLSRSNIRFYEKEKLIQPAKNNNNGYKDYSLEDVDKIKKIAYLRTLGISIDDIRSVMLQEITLYEVIKSQNARLDEQITRLKNSKKMCDMMLQSDALTFEDLNIEAYVTNVDDYWKKNRKSLRFDSAGFLSKWGSLATWRYWMIIFLRQHSIPPDFLLILCQLSANIKASITGGADMADEYGSDFMTIVDEDGTEFELEILSTIEYNGFSYLAVVPAGNEDEDLEVSILKSVDEAGEPILCAIEDEQELETVYSLIMEQLYEEDEEN